MKDLKYSSKNALDHFYNLKWLAVGQVTYSPIHISLTTLVVQMNVGYGCRFETQCGREIIVTGGLSERREELFSIA